MVEQENTTVDENKHTRFQDEYVNLKSNVDSLKQEIDHSIEENRETQKRLLILQERLNQIQEEKLKKNQNVDQQQEMRTEETVPLKQQPIIQNDIVEEVTPPIHQIAPQMQQEPQQLQEEVVQVKEQEPTKKIEAEEEEEAVVQQPKLTPDLVSEQEPVQPSTSTEEKVSEVQQAPQTEEPPKVTKSVSGGIAARLAALGSFNMGAVMANRFAAPKPVMKPKEEVDQETEKKVEENVPVKEVSQEQPASDVQRPEEPKDDYMHERVQHAKLDFVKRPKQAKKKSRQQTNVRQALQNLDTQQY